jgi:Zn-finger nucleic acid-binding protein
MNCPSCGAPLHLTENDDSARCDYCAVLYTPPANDDGVRSLGEASPLACPVCNVPLQQAAIGNRRVLYCGRCQGMLVPMDEFLDLVAVLHAQHPGSGAVQPPANRRDLQRNVDCPQCHRQMDTHLYDGPGNIVIDDCSRCSLNWLDKGEMTKVVRAPDHGF